MSAFNFYSQIAQLITKENTTSCCGFFGKECPKAHAVLLKTWEYQGLTVGRSPADQIQDAVALIHFIRNKQKDGMRKDISTKLDTIILNFQQSVINHAGFGY